VSSVLETKMKNIFLISLILVVGGFAQVHSVIPKNTEIKVRTDTAIPANPVAGSSYSGTVNQDVQDSSGAVLILETAEHDWWW
jgi:hypothetical protein